jgi:cytochrome c-type biogenesis protein CcmH/NrfF
MQRIQIWLGVIAVLAVLASGGVPQERRARIQRLEKAVLAPCCYTETVGRHQSEIAVQMRVEIAKWVEQGRTDDEILDTYAKRYGAKVLVDPNTIPKGWTLVVPWAVGGLGAFGAAWMLWRWRVTRFSTVAPPDAGGGILPDIPDFDDE